MSEILAMGLSIPLTIVVFASYIGIVIAITARVSHIADDMNALFTHQVVQNTYLRYMPKSDLIAAPDIYKLVLTKRSDFEEAVVCLNIEDQSYLEDTFHITASFVTVPSYLGNFPVKVRLDTEYLNVLLDHKASSRFLYRIDDTVKPNVPYFIEVDYSNNSEIDFDVR